MLAQAETENFWDDVGDWFEGAADDVADAVADAAETTVDVVKHPQKYTEMAVEAL